MYQVFLENFRAFRAPGWIKLAPLTILIGENSTGKSAFLAGTRLAFEGMGSYPKVSFNQSPFFLGSFEQIAHVHGGTAGRAKSFSLGYEAPIQADDNASSESYRIVGRFERGTSDPIYCEQTTSINNYKINIARDGGKIINITAFNKKKEEKIKLESEKEDFEGRLFFDIGFIPFYLQNHQKKENAPEAVIKFFNSVSQEISSKILRHTLNANPFGSVQSLAPVRSKPERVYNPGSGTEDHTEGEHVPRLLANSFLESKARWSRWEKSLSDFGQKAGLFTKLRVKFLGKKGADPFQVVVRVGGQERNLIDVGYGISQILPIIFETIRGRARSLYLLQQPEVHLHPRAQAELGSFFANIVSENQASVFVIETHSDYLLNRIRMEIRDGKIRPSDVSFLYFEKAGPETKIHPIGVDADGNLIDVPTGYRKFFLMEDNRFLGI